MLPLLAAAGIRSYCIALTGVLLGLHLGRLGLSAPQIGLIVAAGLAGNAAATIAMALRPERFPLKRTLAVIAFLSGGGLLAFASVTAPLPLLAFAFGGLVNGMGRDRGPAQVLEQAVLSRAAASGEGTRVMVRYAAIQDIFGGLGSLTVALPDLIGDDPLLGGHLLFSFLGLLTIASALLYHFLPAAEGGAIGLDRTPQPDTVRRVRRLTGLFALDSLGGGFLAGAILSYWFFERFGMTGAAIGPLFFAGRILNAASYFGAGFLADRIGLIRTMVYTHLPSSLFLILLPVAPSAWVAVTLFLLREALVQMDVPARQAFVAAVTRPEERVYAYGVTGLARNVGWATGPALAGWSVAAFGLGAPLVIGAGLKVVYDLLLFRDWSKVEERTTG